MNTFLITGATGNLGRAALDSLLERIPAAHISVLTRDPETAVSLADRGVDIRRGDYSDRHSLDRAFTGVDRLIFISSPVLDPSVRAQQHRTVIDAAAAAGVEHIVYTSGMGAPHDPGHSAAEFALVTSDLSHTILRNALYSDAFVEKALVEARTGRIVEASAGRPIVTASIADLGEAAAIAALSRPQRSMWELRGPAWTFDELALTLASLLGEDVRQEEVGDEATGPFAVLFPLIRRGVFSEETPDLAELLGHAPMSVAEVAVRLREHR